MQRESAPSDKFAPESASPTSPDSEARGPSNPIHLLPKNVEESHRAGKAIRAKKQCCYLNSFRVIQEVPGYSAAIYVEGIAVQVTQGGGWTFEHGWIEKDGEIIDPTLPSQELVYFPGLRLIGERGLAEALAIPKPKIAKEDFPIFYRFGWGGSGSPEFAKARKQAEQFALGTSGDNAAPQSCP